ncbi:hypothetical protein ABPG72_010071 [Tetrahymena utriculariae]
MNYFNLENIENQSSRRNKKIIRVALLSLLIVGMFGAIVYFSEPSQTVVVPNMLYMNYQNNDLVITTSRNMTVCSSQGGDGIPDTHQQCTAYNSIQDIVAQKVEGTNMINVFIAYKDITYNTEFNSTGNFIPDESEFKPYLQDEIDLVFKATLTNDGTLLGLYAPKNFTYSELVIRLTERLIEQYFPQLNATLYPQGPSLLLGASEQYVENNYLGLVTPTFSYQLVGDDHVILSKQYTDKNFVQFQYSLGGDIPSINFQSDFVIKDGKVEVNKEVMTFSVNKQEKIKLRETGSIPINPINSTEYIELIGQSNSKIESHLEIISTAHNAELVSDLIIYEFNRGFVQIDLSQNSGKVDILKGGEQNSTLLADAEPIIQKSYDVFRHAIVGNEITLTIDYKNFIDYSEISSSIWLNGLHIYTIYSNKIDHPWYACADFKRGDNLNQHLKIFEVVYPLLGGVLNIPISAYIQIDYGWNFTVGASGVNCEIEFKPYVNPSFEVTGSVSVWKVAKGGVYARGNVANTYVDFLLQLDRKALQLLFTVDAKLIPFEYHIGAFYQYFQCSVRKIIQNIFKFKWGEICTMSDKHEIPLLDGQLLKTLSYNLHRETKPLLPPTY